MGRAQAFDLTCMDRRSLWICSPYLDVFLKLPKTRVEQTDTSLSEVPKHTQEAGPVVSFFLLTLWLLVY